MPWSSLTSTSRSNSAWPTIASSHSVTSNGNRVLLVPTSSVTSPTRVFASRRTEPATVWSYSARSDAVATDWNDCNAWSCPVSAAMKSRLSFTLISPWLNALSTTVRCRERNSFSRAIAEAARIRSLRSLSPASWAADSPMVSRSLIKTWYQSLALVMEILPASTSPRTAVSSPRC